MNLPSAEAPASAPANYRQIFISWEKLRVVYNGILAAVVLAAMCFYTHPSRALTPLLVCALPANLLYFLGPMLESYLLWIGFRMGWMRWAIWLLGTVISVPLALHIAHELLSWYSGNVWGDLPGATRAVVP